MLYIYQGSYVVNINICYHTINTRKTSLVYKYNTSSITNDYHTKLGGETNCHGVHINSFFSKQILMFIRCCKWPVCDAWGACPRDFPRWLCSNSRYVVLFCSRTFSSLLPVHLGEGLSRGPLPRSTLSLPALVLAPFPLAHPRLLLQGALLLLGCEGLGWLARCWSHYPVITRWMSPYHNQLYWQDFVTVVENITVLVKCHYTTSIYSFKILEEFCDTLWTNT